MRCRCGSNKVEADAASGTTYCVACGEVLEENNIVAEVQFAEMSGGKTVLQGTFAGESGRITSAGTFGRHRGKEGQEQAVDNGRQKIARIAHALRLPERYREAAQRYYNLAVANRFTRGRKSDHVAAVCLYIVCRNEQSSQMLIDFSDLLQANVFVLGSTFLKLVRVLVLKLPLIDPSIYISRFAAALDFGDYTQRVAHDAVRLVQRMDRDWIRTGRRPAGICGACLLIAARMNGFRRTTREMIYIVKVADVTIQKRLQEFKLTESSKLSMRDFRTLWLETEADPPAFTKNRKKQKMEELEEGEEAEIEVESRRGSSVSRVRFLNNFSEDTGCVNGDIEKNPEEEAQIDHLINPDLESVAKSMEKEIDEDLPEEAGMTEPIVMPDPSDLPDPETDKEAKEWENELNEWMHDKSVVEATEKLASEVNIRKEEEEHLSDVDDEEIEAVILTPDEVKIKTLIWYNANKEYLEEMAVKAKRLEMDRQNGIIPKKRGTKRKKLPQASTPAEAAKQLMVTKKISRKINQAVFDDMFESPESIAKIKARDTFKQSQDGKEGGDPETWEVVEESGDAPAPKKVKGDGKEGDDADEKKGSDAEEDEDEEDMDSDDMAEDEKFMRDQRAQFGFNEEVTEDNYYDEHGDFEDYD
ncbi:uncharacterized protein BYT42DRAFT_613227 [Radiomyces spectabilis]|uniref:uncharacterized protein n=1 Tax=Radiomyces spectabilis TaxID=64574 RepID=UPI00221F7112|nr:uncharacterized protein BYT42DRAFT_613227 [Radiomyces spectabilis]KAI8381450.1 hypothetical protein BYT42DRAFT_613227 [Radiomyces spectabilis]